jgi:hypothetical protein
MGKVKKKVNLKVLRVNPYVSKGVPQLCLDHFMIFSGLILGLIVSKEGKILDLKKF